MDEEGFRRQYQVESKGWWKVEAALQRYSQQWQPAYRTYDLSDFWNRLSQTTNSRMDLHKELVGFRAAWATEFLKFSFRNIESSLSFDATIWNSLFDSATHLSPFPISTPGSQEAMYMFRSALYRTKPSRQPPPVENLIYLKGDEVLTTYCLVLFGETGKRISPPWSAHLPPDADFISRVHVYHSDGVHFQNTGQVIEIPFDAYCSILDDLMPSIQKLYAKDIPPEASFSSYFIQFGDVIAEAIRKFIRCRLRDAHQYDNVPIVVDARHLTVVRFLLTDTGRPVPSVLWDLRILVVKTAGEFGYATQLDNIDIHAELQYYDPGIYDHDVDIFNHNRRRRSSSTPPSRAIHGKKYSGMKYHAKNHAFGDDHKRSH
ncbi:hypothetical protein BD410DRAFT_903328 [Rickenella mellea]|uniref:Uncharacterized protein n=1 Tax=Rickenella mellea TaxID=50990 RepID=A0A4Y7PDD3_9AGAM|nr:hypothetical protein BD410DRAFT_903328 [Rickenella mellea]